MRKVKKSRLTKMSRNARFINWVIRTKRELHITDNSGKTVAVMIPIEAEDE